jgi:hypothetical protein
MATDQLLSDDLSSLLSIFPSDALRDLVNIMKNHRSWSPFPIVRCDAAHALHDDADFRPHSSAIATEIVWWASNDVHRQWGEERDWPEITRRTAAKLDVDAKERKDGLPAWQIEVAILKKALEAWESLSPEKREEKLRAAGMDLGAGRGAGLGAAGGVAALGAEELIAFLLARGLSFAAGAAVLAPVVAILGVLWAGYDLAGPAYRVIRPVVLNIAWTRWRLREKRVAAAWEI